MNSSYPLTSQFVPLAPESYRRTVFLKRCVVDDNNTVRFSHLGEHFHLRMPVDLKTHEVLIDAGFNVECSGKRMGIATRAVTEN